MNTRVLKKGGEVLIQKVWIADGFFSRGIGLLGRGGLAEGEGLLLSPCSAVHTCLMRFAIDIVYLSEDNKVTDVVWGVRPWRMSRGPDGSRKVLEIESGWFDPELVNVGDVLDLS